MPFKDPEARRAYLKWYNQKNREPIAKKKKLSYEENRAARRATGKRWYEKNKKEINSKRKLAYKHDAKKSRAYWLKCQYEITVSEYDAMYVAQEGKCLLCGKWFAKLCVDHCHSTRKVRGLLCRKCNAFLGVVEQTPSLLVSIPEYLDKHG